MATEAYTQGTGDAGRQAAEMPSGMASSRYAQGKITRQPYLDRARRISALVMPSLFRPEGTTGQDDFEIPWDSSGAYLVANLASKVILALFPPGRPPMKLKASRNALIAMAELDSAKQGELKAEIDKGLSMVEHEFVDACEEDADRARLFVAVLKLIVGGSHCLHHRPNGQLRGVSLDNFVTWRDKGGILLEFVIEDMMSYESMAPDMKGAVVARGYQYDPMAMKTDSIPVYTWGRLMDGRWHICQEVYGFEVEETRQSLNPEALPYQFLPWMLLDGEDYGRSYAENYEGDFQTVDGLTESITQTAAAVARYVELVHPGGLTKKTAVAQAKNGDVITGRAEDVTTLISGKQGDLQVPASVKQEASVRLAKAFLLNSSIQRQGERVTAEEIRFIAQELEDGLGGVYSQQVVTLQNPYVRYKLRALMRAKRITQLPEGQVSVSIITGMAALGRAAEMQALDAWLGGGIQLFGPEQLFATLGPKAIRTYMTRRAAALGVSTEGLLPTPKEAEELDAQQQQQMLLKTLGPEIIKQAGQGTTARAVAETNANASVAAAAIGNSGATQQTQEATLQ